MFIRLSEGAETFSVNFELVFESLNIQRSFNLNRRCTETIGDLTLRISSNVEKSITYKVAKKVKKGEEIEMPDINVKVLNGGTEVPPELTCNNVFFQKESPNLSARILGTDYKIIINPPWINSLAIPTTFLVGFPVYPKKFDASFTSKEECDFVWSISTVDTKKHPSQCSFQQTGKGFIYLPAPSDIGHYVKLDCTPKAGDRVGPSVSLVSQKRVEAGPGTCPFELRHKFTSEILPCSSFRVVSYNILADLYAKSDVAQNSLFPYCPKYALEIDYRKLLIVKELVGYNADLLCLQEVDLKVYQSDLEPVFKSLKFEGVITKKGAQVSEGVACFYRSSRFSLEDSHRVILGEEINDHPCFSPILSKLNEYPALKERVLARTTTLQVLVLKVLDRPNHRLIVGNTHLYFQPAADHIRLLQAGLSIAYINDVVSKIKLSDPHLTTSVILCGDFNSTPDCGVYKLMTEKHVPVDYLDWKSQEGEHIEGLSLEQPFPFASACGTPEFTNFTVGFVGCLDYIFYQTDHLAVEQVIPMPSKEEVTLYTAIPNVVFPSDHLALVADLKWL